MTDTISRLRIEEILGRFLPREMAANLCTRAAAHCGLDRSDLSPEELGRLVDAVQIGIHLFVPREKQGEAKTELQRLAGSRGSPSPVRIDLRSEGDVVTARAQARAIAQRMGARSLVVQRISNVVHELGSNALLHARNGRIEIRAMSAEPRRVMVTAIDEGPGIAALRDVLASDRAGIGLGLRGVKETVDRFKCTTSPRGTVVEAEVLV